LIKKENISFIIVHMVSMSVSVAIWVIRWRISRVSTDASITINIYMCLSFYLINQDSLSMWIITMTYSKWNNITPNNISNAEINAYQNRSHHLHLSLHPFFF
jgi:hypothetical protein